MLWRAQRALRTQEVPTEIQNRLWTPAPALALPQNNWWRELGISDLLPRVLLEGIRTASYLSKIASGSSAETTKLGTSTTSLSRKSTATLQIA